jgi:peptidoglycan/LPS O-acetylase OafA/YrhL
LAIEEQFYLVWPLVVRFCSLSLLRWIAVLVVCVSPVLRLMLLTAGADIYANTFARLDGLMAGAFLAILMRSTGFVPARFLGTAWMVLAIATPLAFVTEALDARWIVFSLSAAASAALVYLSLYSPRSWVQRALGNRFLVYTGTISYGLYLLHKIPFNVGTALHFDRYPLLAAPILFVVAYGMAVLSWRCLEKPFLDLKRHFVTKPALLPAAPALGQPKLTPADRGD